eukprot:GFKZ01000950.1.p1 GENE.GFKZ01000950.1~~GFKZ01000950.1.p1  ORF type:complete len:255 (+),score=27.72 GFKZ01000950.1:251-1015(+)
MASFVPPCIAILYATRGGMGDVGKFAATQAFKNQSICTRVVAMSAASKEGTDNGIDADVRDETVQEQLKTELGKIPITYVNVESESAQRQLEQVFDGVDSVVTCLGNRQPGMARWISMGASKVTAAMQKKNVSRLVQLSSFGIGNDYMGFSAIGVLWGCMLRTVINDVRIDLKEMERVVTESGLDYLLVRTVGIAPECAPEGKWKILRSPKDGKVTLEISKADVGAFMLEEALKPTLRRTAVTIGRDPTGQGKN